MNRVYPKLRSVRELLSTKYAVDFYQREYEWGTENIEELFNDLEARFTANYDPNHDRPQVARYARYFLGTIITCTQGSVKNIVDGQQRLTTLTLLLIHLHHLQQGREDTVDIRDLIFSISYGQKTFNIDVPERNACMRALFENNFFEPAGIRDQSVQNLVDRYQDIQTRFPESLQNGVLPYFIDWLVDNVDLVEIETNTDDDAFTIFETMNDRGKNLGPTDMLKGYLLGNINEADEETEHARKKEANDLWKERIFELLEIEDTKDVDFFKDWLRAQYADTMRERKKGATNRDFENINKFHRWVRDERERIGLIHSRDFYDFVMHNFNHFARIYLDIQRASQKSTNGWEYVYFNAQNGFTLQPVLLLAPIRIHEDDFDVILRKIRLVAGFIDIFIARRVVNYRTLGYSSIQYTMFNLVRRIRGADLWELAEILRDEVDAIPETFDAISQFAMHQRNPWYVKRLLARLTYHVERQAGIESNYDTYVSSDIAKPFEVEHIWSNLYEYHADEFATPEEFQSYRNRVGGLILLPRGFNQSLGADTYEEKLPHYNAQNLLARSLHPQCYEKNPNFRRYIEESGLPFQPHPQFKKADLDARQELYRQIAEEIWDPARFDWELE